MHPMRVRDFLPLGLLLLIPASLPAADQAILEITADPPSVVLSGPSALSTVLVHGKTEEGRLVDLSRAAGFRSRAPRVFSVSTSGLVRPVSDGAGQRVI